MNMAKIFDINGDLVNVDNYSTDVTVKCSFDLLIDLLKNSNELVFLTNGHNKIIYATDKFLKLYGYDENEILNHSPSIFALNGNSEIIYAEVCKSSLAEKWNGKLLSKKSDGSVIVVELNAEKLLTEEGHVYGTMWITRDITHSQNINPIRQRVINKSHSI